MACCGMVVACFGGVEKYYDGTVVGSEGVGRCFE